MKKLVKKLNRNKTFVQLYNNECQSGTNSKCSQPEKQNILCPIIPIS